jgi:glyoxylase-like metal-dependent hydrolase (beta-lactamase superfamily II)
VTVPELDDFDIALVRADNPGSFTLTGTNTWLLGRDPCWVVDPGPALPGHLDAVAAEVARRGGAGGIAITHDHEDHVEGVPGLVERLDGDVPVAAARFPADVRLGDGGVFGPLRASLLPGHAPDHLVFVSGDVCFAGDAVLGEGSVIVGGDLRGYLAGLERLRSLPLRVICPGHGPVVWSPRAKLDQYIAHRLERERKLVAALDAGRRAESDLLDAAWDDVPASMRPAAAFALAAHLEKLREEGRLPDDV